MRKLVKSSIDTVRRFVTEVITNALSAIFTLTFRTTDRRFSNSSKSTCRTEWQLVSHRLFAKNRSYIIHLNNDMQHCCRVERHTIEFRIETKLKKKRPPSKMGILTSSIVCHAIPKTHYDDYLLFSCHMDYYIKNTCECITIILYVFAVLIEVYCLPFRKT